VASRGGSVIAAHLGAGAREGGQAARDGVTLQPIVAMSHNLFWKIRAGGAGFQAACSTFAPSFLELCIIDCKSLSMMVL
jgi:hypothetical protein